MYEKDYTSYFHNIMVFYLQLTAVNTRIRHPDCPAAVLRCHGGETQFYESILELQVIQSRDVASCESVWQSASV